MNWALDFWRGGEWITMATYPSKSAARTRACELRLAVWRVREVTAVHP